uniref:Heme-binding protein soul2 n=1 Tax=Iconisemion striatum TaxID=60296 RepID=A0A1A7WFC8_9TELE
MMKLLLSLLVLVPVCYGDYAEFCHQMPCPEYTVVETNQAFEKREYVATKWITTTMPGNASSDFLAANERLKGFWMSQKEAGKEIPDTWPVLITSTDGTNGFIQSLSWFLPPGPEPQIADPSVYLLRKSASTIYVKSFGGVPSVRASQESRDALKNYLTTNEITYNPQITTAVFYDSYFAFSHHNEVWFYAA